MENKHSQAADAFEILKQRIISYELEPGRVISVNNLAQELEMSRTPVREAVLMLQSYGLVTINGNMQVTKLELSDIIEICQVREAVETQAVKIILEKGPLPSEQVAELKRIALEHSVAVQRIDHKEFFNSGALFHQRIVEFSGNTRLMDIFEKMSLQNKRAQWLNALLPDRRQASLCEHTRVIEGLEKGDLEMSIEGVKEHAYQTVTCYRQILATPEIRRAILEISNLVKQQLPPKTE